MSRYDELRKLGFGRVDSLKRILAYRAAKSVRGKDPTYVEIELNERLLSLEGKLDNVHFLQQELKEDLATTVMILHVSYRFNKEFFSRGMARRYEAALRRVPESYLEMIKAIDALPSALPEFCCEQLPIIYNLYVKMYGREK